MECNGCFCHAGHSVLLAGLRISFSLFLDLFPEQSLRVLLFTNRWKEIQGHEREVKRKESHPEFELGSLVKLFMCCWV